jgi:hypothetical protein
MRLTFRGKVVAIRSGALVPVLVMLPNIAWMLLPKADEGDATAVPFILTAVENVSRAVALTLPFFYSIERNRRCSMPVMIGMALALAVYYACWIRYFLGGSSPELLAAPFLGIPLPMAVAPAVFLVLSSYLMGSRMFTASALFGVAHVWSSNIRL